jgi:tellurite resistance protein TerC
VARHRLPAGRIPDLTGIKTARAHGDDSEGEGEILPFLRRHLPYTPRIDGHQFFTFENGRRVVTPLLLAVLVIEITDVVFAVDSIPAVFAISTVLVITSVLVAAIVPSVIASRRNARRALLSAR